MTKWLLVLLCVPMLALLVVLMVVLVRRVDDNPRPERAIAPVTLTAGDLDVLFPAPPSTSTTTMFVRPPSKRTAQPRARTAPIVQAATMLPVGELADIIRAGFARFGPVVAEEAVRVAGCESTGDDTGQRLDPGATNGVHVGLFQLSGTYHKGRAARLGYKWAQMYDATANTAVAADLYGEQKWGPWTCKHAA